MSDILPVLAILIGFLLVVFGSALQSSRPSFLVGLDMVFWGLVAIAGGLVMLMVRVLGGAA